MVDVLDQASEDPEEIVVSWLLPLQPLVEKVAVTRVPGDPLPFVRVGSIPGEEDVDAGTANCIVVVEVFCQKVPGEEHVAAAVAKKVHQRMTYLARNLSDVVLSEGQFASIDYVTVFKSPHWVDYKDDQILCKEAQYRMGLSYVPAS